MSSVKNRTTPGADRIKPDHLKNLLSVPNNILAQLLTRYLSECKIPALHSVSQVRRKPASRQARLPSYLHVAFKQDSKTQSVGVAVLKQGQRRQRNTIIKGLSTGSKKTVDTHNRKPASDLTATDVSPMPGRLVDKSEVSKQEKCMDNEVISELHYFVRTLYIAQMHMRLNAGKLERNEKPDQA
ncbi:hypothetical protein KIN20_027158 [Parelaphostrongylus tenuis]|uniref:Uncharacterized protein n=1 Tax=Parelaphostrongylus tenuis TaxID=148309 RepID=A0AAD5QZ19_PARTN|nr:hypothetical protein KIN20_027158 [Parelaphostrongylus tenuis]